MTSATKDSKSLSSSDHVVLAAKDVNVFYGDFKAVQHVDLECYRGQITALIGPSGCGKTTLLRCFALLELPSEGRIVMEGTPISTASHLSPKTTPA